MTETVTETANRGRILVGMDASVHAVRALVWAAREAAARGLPLHLVNALDLPKRGPGVLISEERLSAGRSASRLLLDQAADQVHRLDPTLRVTSETPDADAAETLIALGGEDDLIVTGTRGHGGFAGLLLGSVSLRTAAHAHCPTIVVRGTANDAGPRDTIVLGVERNEDEAPIHFAFESCERLGARLLVVRAWLSAPSYAAQFLTDEPATDAEHLDDIETLIKAVRDEHPDVWVTLRTIRGNAVPSLIDAAQGARVIVIGAHRRRAPMSVGAGYVVQGLLSLADTPIAVVPIA